jgi:DDE superfamily endonuclease
VGLQFQSSKKEICQYCLKGREGIVQKRVEEIITSIPKEEGFTVAVLDESIFVHDVLVRRKIWVPKEIRPVVTTTGSHQKIYVFGTLTIDYNKQFFRQYHAFNEDVFLDYLKKLLQKKTGKVILFIDRAAQQHYRSRKVRTYLEENKDVIRVTYFPKGSPELNAVEEC